MYEAVYMAASGLKSQQTRLDTIGDNIANTNTVGFKNSRLDFADALYTAGLDPSPAYTPDGNLQKGHGVTVSAIKHDFGTGALITTNNMTDLAIEGDAFFQVVDEFGERLYTRNGSLYTMEGVNGELEIVNGNGHFMQDVDGNRIIVPEGAHKFSVTQEGIISFTAADDTEILGTAQLGMYTFDNKSGLSSVGSSNYVPTAASGEAVEATDFKVNQFMLENSNVDMATEMTRLLRTQRAFSLAARALTTADDMEGIANQMRS